MLGLIGWPELLLMLAVIAVFVAMVGGAVALVLWVSRRKGESATPRSAVATKRLCPQCGNEMAADAPQGLCPNCLMKVAMGSDAGNPAPGSSEKKPAPATEEIAKYFPQFEILSLLGQGGMGAVYKARQPSLDRFVALKILPPQAAADAGFAERFNREARALAKLSHPNIVAVYDFGQADGLHYLVMEFVDGLNLRQLQQSAKLPPREALQIIPQICEALQFAHDEGVVHRDIKPENVLLDKKGRVKIADFGLARILGVEPESYRLTGAKDFMGTPHYMAPEQIEHPQAVDHRADIYSLGVVFYEMLTGELPLGRFAPPSKKVQVDVRLDEVVLHALERDVALRYQNASEVKTDVENIVLTRDDAPESDAPVTAAPAPESASIQSARRRVKGPAVGLLVTGIINWLLIPLASMLIYWSVSREAGGGFPALPPNLLVSGCLTSLVSCCFIIYAALKMMQLERRGAAMVASILAVIITPGNLIGLPMGIWALVVLNHPEVKAAFARLVKPVPPAQAMGPVLRSVQNPATGLVITGILSWAAVPFSFYVLWRLIHDSGPGQAINTFLSMGVLPMIVGTLMIMAGQKMKRLEAYRLAVVACILPMGMLVFKMVGMLLTRSITIGPGDLVGAPMGLWALVVLSRPEVKAAFMRAASTGLPGKAKSRGWFATTATVLLIALGLIAITAVAAGVVYLARSRNSPRQAETMTVTPSEGADPDLAELRDVQATNNVRPKTNLTAQAEFGQAQFALLYSLAGRRPSLFDLNLGKTLRLPSELQKGTEEQFFSWISQNGADLMAQDHRTTWTLTTSLKLASLPEGSWSNVTLATLREALTFGTNSLLREDTVFGYDQYRLEKNVSLPLTFALETRQGGLGVLQITSFKDDPPVVMFRYKLERGASSANDAPAPQAKPDDIADVTSTEHHAGGDTNKVYFLIGGPDITDGGKHPRPLLIVLPGGDGGRDFHPFVKRISRNALPPGYLVAQLVAPKWDERQVNQLVWPTEKTRYPAMRFSTEAFVHAVITDIEKKHSLDTGRIFTLSWSSGGPAAYATSLYPNTRVSGSLIAMSVFKPDQLPDVSAAKGHAYYLLHSPTDFIPLRMAELAHDTLASNKAKVHLETYTGGHGWHGDVYGMIGGGVRWLEQQTSSSKNPVGANP